MPDGDQHSKLYKKSEHSQVHLPGRWQRLAESSSCLGSLPNLLTLSPTPDHAGLIAGPSSMQTLTLSFNPIIKNKLGFESKAIGAFDLGYKAKQLLHTKAPIYLWNGTDIFEAGTKKLT